MAARDTTYLYILCHGDGTFRYYKVGIASNVDARVSQLQTGNPHRLEIAYTAAFPDRRIALRVERRMHDLLVPERAIGEWFGRGQESVIKALFEAVRQECHLPNLRELIRFLGFESCLP